MSLNDSPEGERLIPGDANRTSTAYHQSDDEETAYDDEGQAHANDKDILDEEDEREKLLSSTRGGGLGRLLSSRQDPHAPVSKREKKRSKRRARHEEKALSGEDSELMYEMEEGAPLSASGSSRDSSLADMARIGPIHGKKAVSILGRCVWRSF